MPEFEQRRPICAGAMARGRGQKQPGMDWMAAAEALAGVVLEDANQRQAIRGLR